MRYMWADFLRATIITFIKTDFIKYFGKIIWFYFKLDQIINIEKLKFKLWPNLSVDEKKRMSKITSELYDKKDVSISLNNVVELKCFAIFISTLCSHKKSPC
jgi:hypothetical protein